jgi:hypothetical protein
METTEKIVEAYVRYIKGWATIPNIKCCSGQYEIDLLAINPVTLERNHIETGVSISGGFSKLTNKTFSIEALKTRGQTPVQRRTLGYLIERKFGPPEVAETLAEYGFKPGSYTKVIATWGWTDDAAEAAKTEGIELWDFRKIVQAIGAASTKDKTYFTDDTMRTIQLFAKALHEA